MTDDVEKSARLACRVAFQAVAMIAIAWSLPVSAGAQDALPASQWRLRFLAITCRSAPCPDWQVQDRKTGAWFAATVHFENIKDSRHAEAIGLGSVDLLADGDRSELTISGRSYTAMVIRRVVGEASAN